MCQVCEQAKVFPFLMCWQRAVSVVVTSQLCAGPRSGPKLFGGGVDRRIVPQGGVGVGGPRACNLVDNSDSYSKDQ